MSVADILQQMAENAGRAQLRRGALIGNTIAQAAAVPGQILDDREKHALLLRQQAMQDATAGYAKNADDRATRDQAMQDAAARTAVETKAALQAGIKAGFGASTDPKDFSVANAARWLTENGHADLVPTVVDVHDKMQPKLTSRAAGSVMSGPDGKVIPGSEVPAAPPTLGSPAYEVWSRAQALQQPQPMNPGDVGPAQPGLPPAEAAAKAYADQRTAVAAEKNADTHSPAYKEWQDHVAAGGKLSFDAYQTMDANRKRPLSITNAATDDKTLDEAARNILANPRDLTSIKNITTLRGDQRLKLFNRLKQMDPTFNVGNIDRQIKFLDSYENPAGKPAMNRQSMNNILMHSADLSDVNQEYRRSNVRLVNTPINQIQKQYSTDYERYATTVAVLKDEIGLYFAGGYAPTKEQGETWTKILNDQVTPNQIEAFAKQVIHVGLRRASTHNSDFKAMMGYDDPNLITPDAVKAGEHLGLGAAMKPFGSGGTLGAPALVSVTDPQGGVHQFPTQAKADAFKKAAGIP